jgi:hypothetical protein
MTGVTVAQQWECTVINSIIIVPIVIVVPVVIVNPVIVIP